jgi:RNA polymerase sporulation-specific sigma factor
LWARHGGGPLRKDLLVARISHNPNSEPKVEDLFLIALAKRGDRNAYERLVRRYHGFVRLKASSYFLAGGDSEDLIQEGLVGLYKAIRDFRTDRESSFRNFAELCITRQIITAVKTATRNKHTPLNQYVSFSSTPAGTGDDVPTLDQMLPGPSVQDPVNQVISSEELRSLVGCLSTALSELESRVLSLYLDGYSYEQVGGRLSCDTKTVDNALQRVKRKVGAHLQSRAVAAWVNCVRRAVAAPGGTATDSRSVSGARPDLRGATWSCQAPQAGASMPRRALRRS